MTYIYETLSTNNISRAFYNDDNASWHKDTDACDAIAKYLENLAEETEMPMELDTVAFRCDYSMYKNIAELNKEYDTDFEDMNELENSATVIKVDDEKFITDFAG